MSKEKTKVNATINNAAVCRQLWTDVAKAEASRDYDRALKLCNRIIKLEETEDKTAHWCKAVCMMQLSKFDDSLNVMKKNALQDQMAFEKAYCEYRLNRFDEAVKTAETRPDDPRCKELMAQICYKQESYESCLSHYKELLRDHEDEYEEERQVNLLAVLAQLGNVDDYDQDEYEEERQVNLLAVLAQLGNVDDYDQVDCEDKYDQGYNQACRLLARGRAQEAAELLRKSEKVCTDTLDEEELEEELPVIQTQLAYALQLQGKDDEACEINQEILKQKPSDVTLGAVASNNLVASRGLQSIWDSRKKMKACTGKELQQKLNSKQKMVITANNALVNLHSNQIENCRNDIKELEKYGSDELAVLLKASLAIREKKLDPAVKVLKDVSESQPSERVTLTLAQLLLSEGKHEEAVSVLNRLSHCPGVMGVCVGALLSMGVPAAESYLKAQLDANKNNQGMQKIIHEELARLAIQAGNYPKATENLEALRRLDPENPTVLAKLIKVYSQYDLAKAEALSSEADFSAHLNLDVSVDELENTSWMVLGAKKGKKGVKSPEQGAADVKKKRKKKRKLRLPKNYDPNAIPDPERWLPRRERTGYKRRKDKRAREKEISRGPQGAVSAADVAALDASQKKSPGPSNPTSPAAPQRPAGAGTRGQRPAAKKGKKKGGKDKW